ncbi:hypothetical protein BCR33DRAFT_717027 [Rhizoclosmatium globosum]|uniref:Protein PNS1 n=1 Tax=Rhizoclosmatium globosum TaxID=329046 RepID=A0A1Y2CBW8_9FUNG|nr:hypothetical protein BCR33DRAFT_717027 [Rhizoclosmatium globosum]|eukprot:ORY44532.1 hypothetical protein BCR33DRAFT_717027 [Rhizoclosmatium globosum]
MSRATSTTPLLPLNPSTPRKEYAVLSHSPRRRRCNDWAVLVPFVSLLVFVVVFGVKGARLVSSPSSFCEVLGPSNSNSGFDAGLAVAEKGGDVYNQCIHFIVTNDLASARSRCLANAVNSLAGLDMSGGTTRRRRALPSLPGSVSVPNLGSLPGPVQSAFTLCTLFIAQKSPTAPLQCIQYGLSAFLGPLPDTASVLMASCLNPVLQSPDLSKGTLATCIDVTVASLLPSNRSTTPSQIYTNCVSSTSVVDCVTKSLSAYQIPQPMLQTLTSTCITPAQDSSIPLSKTLSSCLSITISSIYPSTSLQTASSLTKALGGSSPVFNLINQSITALLTSPNTLPDLAQKFSTSCLAKTIGDLSAGKGVAADFCRDVVSASPYSIVGGLNAYFSSFRDRIAQNARKVAYTFVVIVIVGVVMAMVWMSVLVVFGEGIIKFSIISSMLNLLGLIIVNFLILNIPLAVILIIYFVGKAIFYVIAWPRIRFASIILRATVSHLKRNPSAWKSILSVSVAGSLGTWYYSPIFPEKQADSRAIVRAAGRACTYSFGTICLASLCTASLKTLHYIYKRGKNSSSKTVKTIVTALLGFLAHVLQVFNLYALVRVGVPKIVHSLDWDITLMLTITALFFGWAMLSIMGVTVEMGVVALFVCLAEDPEVLLFPGKKEECRELVEALVERCRERGWQIPGEVARLEEKMKEL